MQFIIGNRGSHINPGNNVVNHRSNGRHYCGFDLWNFFRFPNGCWFRNTTIGLLQNLVLNSNKRWRNYGSSLFQQALAL